MLTISPDIKQSLRFLAKKPGFVVVVLLTLALGIGVSTAIFSLVDAMLLRSLPFKEPDRLVIIESVKGGEKGGISLREIQDIIEKTNVFQEIAAYRIGAAYNFSGVGEPEELPATLCSHNLFKVLGIDFELGTTWPAELDTRRGFGIVLSNEVWQRKFEGKSDVLGQLLTLDASPTYQVHGVLPKGFEFPHGVDLYRSIVIGPSQVINRQARGNTGLARLRPDANLQEARDALRAVSQQLAAEFPTTNTGLTFEITPLRTLFFGNIRPYLWLLSAAVIFVLLIACVNVANLLLSHAVGRDKEVAVRSVMGAERGRILRQFLTESIILGVGAGVLGILISIGLIGFFRKMFAPDLPSWVDIQLNLPVLIFAILLSILTGIVAGIVPAFQVSKTNLVQLMRESRGSTGGKHRNRLRKVFVVVQLAMGMLLLVGSALMLQSFRNLQRAELGFDPDHLLTFQVALPWSTYGGNPDKTRSFYSAAIDKISKLPGVKSVATNSNLPLSADDNEAISRQAEFTIEGQSPLVQKENPYAYYMYISPDYFKVMDIPVIEGRNFTVYDTDQSIPIAIVSKRLAKQFWGNESPLGKRIKPGNPESEAEYLTVVGVVEDVKMREVDLSPGYDIYVSSFQQPYSNAYFVVKTSVPPMQLSRRVTEVIWEVDAEQSTYNFQTMDAYIDQKLWQHKITGNLFSSFALLAILLSAIGIYSVMSYAVRQRTKELGVRRVLGASGWKLMKMILGEVLLLVTIGVGIGLCFAWILSGNIQQLLYDIKGTHLSTYILVALFLMVISILAALLPTIRATRINPVEALRSE